MAFLSPVVFLLVAGGGREKEESPRRDMEEGGGGEESTGLLIQEAEEGEAVLVEVLPRSICDGERRGNVGS